MKRLSLLVTCICSLLLVKTVLPQCILPVRNLQYEDCYWITSNEMGYLEASWDAPRKTLITEDFEGSIFPPPGWQTTSGNPVGWFASSNGCSQYLIIPPHTTYAVANDDTLGATGNSCCDYLILPEVDLTVCQGFKLSFDSYFNGNNGQKATVEMSIDNGNTWNPVQEMVHFPNWKHIEIDLSAWSGNSGLSSVKFAFHADDLGNQASGWAVDNVLLQSDSVGNTGYTVFLNQDPLAATIGTSYILDPAMLIFGQNYSLCVRADYPAGLIADTCISFTSFYLYPPSNLQATPSDSGVMFTWEAPQGPPSFEYYNLYLDTLTVIQLQSNETTYFLPNEYGETCIALTAVHNGTLWGFPGMLFESCNATACGFVDTGFGLPFTEDFTSGTLSLNKWTAGNNWAITGQAGYPAPSVKFSVGKSVGSYSSELTSWYFNAQGFDPCPSSMGANLHFHLKLDDMASNGTEVLIVELLNEHGTIELKRYKNEGSFDWIPVDIEISHIILDDNFRVRFLTEGDNMQNIQAWYIDNINLHRYITDYPPNIEIHAARMGTPENDILISWSDYNPTNETVNYILDDGIAEGEVSQNKPGEIWIGNEFPATDEGVLQKATVFIKDIPGSTTVYTIDIYDASRNLVGSSQPFVPSNNAFTNVNLPDIPFSSTFYAMLHISAQGFSDALEVDVDGPNAQGELGWVSDGINWTKLTEHGFSQGVFMLRISALTSVSGPTIDTTNPCGTVGYNIYRYDYAKFPPGYTNSSQCDYKWIGSVPFGTTKFVDQDLDNTNANCYMYNVGIQSPTSEIIGVGYAWECIFVDTKEPEEDKILVSPNPAKATVTFQFPPSVRSIQLFNYSGIPVFEQKFTGETSLSINTSQLQPGVYMVRFINTEGESLVRKLVVVH